MKHLFLAPLILSAFLVNSLQAQDLCEVKVMELVGEYEGECKRGVAHGQGTAIGENTYEGEWSKGYPDGSGTYTWANGDVYIGEFKKGRRDGEGTMTFSNGDEKKGFWDNDEYLGEYEKPYKVTGPPNGVNYTLTRRNDQNSRVSVQVRRNNAQVDLPDLSCVTDSGTEYITSTEFGYDNVDFPISLDINYTMPDLMGGGTNYVRFRVVIYQPGDWLIELKH